MSFKDDPNEVRNLLMAGNVQLGDVHSHNTMAAFFSGTDDANDAKKVGVAGVIGSIKDSSYEMKWRMCFGYDKGWQELSAQDVIDYPEPIAASFPESWLQKVSAPKYAYGKTDLALVPGSRYKDWELEDRWGFQRPLTGQKKGGRKNDILEASHNLE
ncbi:MAG: Mov34/MPN/PAD-1 family protein, partial [Acidobacteriaceae bacterium]